MVLRWPVEQPNLVRRGTLKNFQEMSRLRRKVARDESMIRKSGNRFSEKIMLKQRARA
jgi:hypothetical protein